MRHDTYGGTIERAERFLGKDIRRMAAEKELPIKARHPVDLVGDDADIMAHEHRVTPRSRLKDRSRV
jgi:hypothetical protein